jgi:hypothetical protein
MIFYFRCIFVNTRLPGGYTISLTTNSRHGHITGFSSPVQGYARLLRRGFLFMPGKSQTGRSIIKDPQ